MAVAAAAESVTSELAEQVRVTAVFGSEFIVNGPRLSLRENSSAIIRCGTLMPSPINKTMFFGVSDKAENATEHNNANNKFFILC